VEFVKGALSIIAIMPTAQVAQLLSKAALIELEQRRVDIQQKIAEVRAMLGGGRAVASRVAPRRIPGNLSNRQ
jgi:hypothetical protein